MKLGKNMKHALNFARTYPGWHTFAKDRATLGALRRLESRRMIETNEFRQFRAVTAS
jgi:xylose isomerase